MKAIKIWIGSFLDPPVTPVSQQKPQFLAKTHNSDFLENSTKASSYINLSLKKIKKRV